MHQHTELCKHEVRIAKLVADQSRTLGSQPRIWIASTGVTAIRKGGKPAPRIANALAKVQGDRSTPMLPSRAGR